MTSGPWDADIDTILTDFPSGAPADANELRDMLGSAWQFGYTTGMADAETFERALSAGRDWHVISIQGPLEYPGGKDGMFLARCSCGEYASAIGPEAEVRKAGAAHVREKRRKRGKQ